MKTSTKVNNIINKINDTKLSKSELYQLHYHVGNMIGRRMFYQLVFKVGGVSQYRDHTDWYHEVMDDLASLIVKSMNNGHVDVLTLPTDIFITNGNTIEGVTQRFRNDDDLSQIMAIYLGKSYSYEIIQHEISI